MNELLNKILDNSKNQRVFKYLKLEKGKNIYIKSWTESYSGFDDGACVFFDNYGQFVPGECKFSFDNHSIMVNSLTGEIFALNIGRFSIFFKCDFSKSSVQYSDSLKKGYTFDCITDITEFGGNWCFIDSFDNKKDELKWSYELTNK